MARISRAARLSKQSIYASIEREHARKSERARAVIAEITRPPDTRTAEEIARAAMLALKAI